jgi:hypothetical protein
MPPLLFCLVWIAVGLLLVRIATTPIPGIVTVGVNAAIFIGLVAPSSSRAAFAGPRQRRRRRRLS